MFNRRLDERSLLVDLLSMMFGLGAWLGINGVYVQLPLLVNTAPEGWNLPAVMVLLVQFANLGPILYSLYSRRFGSRHDRVLIYIVLGAGTAAVLALTALHRRTAYLFGEERSVALLSLMFVTALVGCTSSVLFMPYLRNYREIYMVSYLIGEGLSGFVPSVAALSQGVGGNPYCVNVTDSTVKVRTEYPEPRFSTEAFFAFLGVLMFLTFLSFLGLNRTSAALSERVKVPASSENLPAESRSYKANERTVSKRSSLYLLALITVISFFSHGILPSVQSYSCLPYGNVAYHLTVTLASIAGPLAMSLGFIIKRPRISHLSVASTAVVVLSGYVLYVALRSPHPPLRGSSLGELLIVSVWILVNGLIGYAKMGVTVVFRAAPGKGLYYTGVATQVGSLVGAVLTYVLVVHTQLFQSYSPCQVH